MHKKTFHVGRPNLGQKELLLDLISDTIDRNWFTNDGPLVQELEKKLASRLGVKHCVLVSNGTVALELALRGLDINGEVILPSFTFVATAHALSWLGIKPVFCDIDPETLCIDPKAVKSLITDKTAAILGVHVYGRHCDIEALERISLDYKIPIIYDAAHAIGCSFKDNMIGNFGNCEVFSFHATKVFHTLEGGAITTNDSVLAQRLRRTRNFGFPGDGGESSVELGTNAKMNEFCAATGLVNLKSLEGFINTNQVNHEAYKSGLSGITGIDLLEFNKDEANNFHYVILLVNESEFGCNREHLLEILHKNGILARRYFSPGCHTMQPYISDYPDDGNRLGITTAIASQTLAMPTGSQLGPLEIEAICRIIGECQK